MWITTAVSSAIDTDAEAGGMSVVKNPEVHLEELTQRLDSRHIRLVDVREPHDIEETGLIPTSISIPRTTASFRSINL